MIFTASSEDNTQVFIQIMISEPLIPYCKTYLKASELSSGQYLKSNPSVDSNPHYLIERQYLGPHLGDSLRTSDVLLQDLFRGLRAVI